MSDDDNTGITSKGELMFALVSQPPDSIKGNMPDRPLTYEEVNWLAEEHGKKIGGCDGWIIDVLDIPNLTVNLTNIDSSLEDSERVLTFALRTRTKWRPFEYQPPTGWVELESVARNHSVDVTEDLELGTMKRVKELMQQS